jgi:ABC-2 type transport system ATP-binding protein
MQPVIELDNLEVRFGERPILKKLNGSLTGRAIGLLGPNGAGKSTLLNTLLGFHKTFSGTARIFGMDIRTEAKGVRSLLGYMPENDSFIAGITGVHFVRLMAELSGLPPEQAMERAHEAFFWVGLGEARYRNLGTYSLGMKQMAKLAQAIVHGPKLLFLDEPTNGLDPPARARMIQILKEGRIAAYCNLEEERRANRKFLELEIRGANGTFAAAIERLGCEAASFPNGRMKLVMPDGVEIRQLYQLAAEKNVQIRRLNHKRDSLEDIFLKAMEAPNGGV